MMHVKAGSENTLKKAELDHLARVLMDRKGRLPRSRP
jgi:hypothetical protein